ncbi:putative DUF890 domain containing protein [Rhypophila sp. PSN 637]
MATQKRKAPADEHCVDEPPTEKDEYYRSLYGSEPDFRALARKDPDFAHFLHKDGRLDFTDPAGTMQLTRTLLKQDFGLQIELPDDRLCPPVPNRHNYILWLKMLLDTSSYREPGGKLRGLDIGTGASCIYPLLGTAQRPWCFIATDIDEKSLGYARKNVGLNGLEERIRVVERKATDTLIPLDDLGVQSIDFTMMNPPFYASDQEMLALAEKKDRPPHSTCTGAPIEMVCDGGEVAHVGRMLQESLTLRNRVQWYTAMVGKASSLELLVEELRKNGIDNYAVSELVQGTKTRRWTLGWSFGPMRPVEAAARGIKTDWIKGLPPITRVNLLRLLDVGDIPLVTKRINEVIGSLELQSWVWEAQSLKGIGRARENVWGRAWRRRKQREMAGGQNQVDAGPTPTNADDCKLGFSTTQERISTNTVGLVALDDFRKRRAEVLEQQEREAREAALAALSAARTANSTPDRSLTATPNNAAAAANASSADNSEAEKHKKKKVKRAAKALVSFGGDEEDEEDSGHVVVKKIKRDAPKSDETGLSSEGGDSDAKKSGGKKITVNSSVGIVPRALTKAALRREAAEREALRKEFLQLQAAVKATEIAIPFVFYDGTNIPGGMVRVKKGDFVWVFLDKSRKVGAELGVGGDKLANARRSWARVGVDDLMLVRGSLIIPHHYEFYFFIINKTVGPGNKRLFDYSAEAPLVDASPEATAPSEPLSTPGQPSSKVLPDIRSLEGASDDPTFTKVVDRRWYQRNKHIYPASVWQEFDPEKDYQSEIRRDPGGNAFFFSG